MNDDLISRQAAIEVIERNAYRHTYIDQIVDIIKELPSAQEKPFNLPEIYIAEGYDTIEGEDGNVGFGVYVPDETKIYVAGDVEGEIRARALFHEVCHWVQAMCGRPFDEDEANEFSDIVYDALPSAQPEITHCAECIHWKHSDVRKNFVRCKDCKYHSHDAEYGRDWCNRTSGVFRVKPDDFCSFAERRPDGN